jgi:RNA polymerase-associated protein RTF1
MTFFITVQTRASKQTTAEGESESDLDYGRDSDDSDDDYEESTMLKPWQQQKGKKKQMSESSDDESMGADDDDQQMPKGSIETRTEDTEASLEDYYKVSIPRRRLMRWCNEPYFEVAVKNFYVRLGIGRDTLTQKPCYRLCRIIGVVIKSEYNFSADQNQKQVSVAFSFAATLVAVAEFLSFTFAVSFRFQPINI